MTHAATARSVCVALALGMLATLAPTPTVAASPGPAAVTDPSRRDDPLLEEPTGGAAAVRELGDRLAVAARTNDLPARRLEALLRTDATTRLATDGRLFYVEPTLAERRETLADRPLAGRAVAPLADTFALHSSPGARRTILLDVDGHSMAGSAWGAVGTNHPAWDPGSNGALFDDAERAAVQQIWSMVAEDFAAYDVDVTTQDPGAAGIVRSSSSDHTYGTRALISPSDSAWSAVCDRRCGGSAYVDVFAHLGGTYQPAWVFPQGLSDSPPAIAEATSHEVGHNLGLLHDGIDDEPYYAGHGGWAPIMGVGYDRPITQWSRGEYAGATSAQDDLAVIGGHLARRADEVVGAPPSTGYVTSDRDIDTFHLGQCATGSQVVVRHPSVSPDLDLRARLLTPDGTVLATADPPSGALDSTRSYGMDAALDVPTTGRYLVDVTGVGTGAATGSAPDGYTGYGSIGAYEVVAAGCDKDVSGVPGRPVGLVEAAAASPSTLSLGWAAPVDAGTSPVAGYAVSGGPGPDLRLGPDVRAVTLDGLTGSTTYDLSVAAVNAHGPGVPAVLRLTTAAAPAAPSRMVRPEVVVRGTSAVVRWRTAAANGSPVTSFRILVSGERAKRVGAVRREAVVRGITRGPHTVRLTATNAVGTSPPGAATRFRVR